MQGDYGSVAVADDKAWAALAAHWDLRADTIYLNHGSFGLPPRNVRRAKADWQQRLDMQPMDFYVRQYEPAYFAAREALARFVHAPPSDLVFAENATAAMNHVAASFALSPGDEVLLTDHEYGAVNRIWERACAKAKTAPPKIATLPRPITDVGGIIDSLVRALTPQTKLLVVSHITSATALTLPIAEICQAMRERNVAMCVDGPHAIAQLPLNLAELGADFYCASCHKWLCAPLGSGFLYVAPQHQASMQPALLSWGRVRGEERQTWDDEFIWSGTRDNSGWLAVPAAIAFLEQVGLEAFRARTHHLAQYARRRLVDLLGTQPLMPDEAAWYGSMAHVPLPDGDAPSLQRALWERHRIETPIIAWGSTRWIRVSCHLYNTKQQIDRLIDVLPGELGLRAA